MRASYRRWLEHQGYADGTVQTQLNRAGRVEECYGDLDEHYGKDRLERVIAELRYSTEDARRSKPNPSKIPFKGETRTNLASYKNAVERYCKFRREDGNEGVPYVDENVQEDQQSSDDEERGRLIGLERDMQAALRQEIEQLEPGLEIADDGAERSVESGRIDIAAQDPSGANVVIELKTGTARQKAIAQILSYMGDVAEEEPDPRLTNQVQHRYAPELRWAQALRPTFAATSPTRPQGRAQGAAPGPRRRYPWPSQRTVAAPPPDPAVPAYATLQTAQQGPNQRRILS